MSPSPTSRPRLSARRPAAVGVLALALVAIGAGCGKPGKIAVSGPPAPITPTTVVDHAAPSTSAGVDTSESTTAPGTEDTGGGSTTTSDTVENATFVSWTSSPGEYRGQDGLRVAYDCPADGTISTIWGTGPFSDDSSVCSAAVFAGHITAKSGGRVVVEISPGLDTYAAGEANGVTADQYGVWAGSFILVSS